MTVEEIEIYLMKYGEDLFRFCCFLTGKRDRAEDLYQDTFLKAMELPREVAPEEAKKFLAGMAANIWKNEWRKEKRRQKIIHPVEFDGDDMSFQAEENASQKADILDDYVRKETCEAVRRVVDALPEKYRIIILMYYSMDLSTKEIAEELHMSKGTVTSRLLRAREKIKKGLEAGGYER